MGHRRHVAALPQHRDEAMHLGHRHLYVSRIYGWLVSLLKLICTPIFGVVLIGDLNENTCSILHRIGSDCIVVVFVAELNF